MGNYLMNHCRRWLAISWVIGLAFTLPALAADNPKKGAPKGAKKGAGKANAAAPKKDDPFAEIIRKTEAQTPEQEQKQFHLPPGFEIQLVAADPDIAKPMNMAFDARGRLWITESREYPFPAAPDKTPRDKVTILDQFSADGRAGKISTFTDGLNIPIGMYPYKNGALVFSIPNIYYVQDTDGDGKADKKELILGRFGFEKDTHGLTSSFRRGYDGWVYADHGFNNDTFLTAKDGSTLKMNSGNCYRFKPDGSHVEIHSWGQVNPFGLMFDALGDLWSADCHSMPVYQLLRGAYYPSFGKPDDGLGFGPQIMKHQHGSTAIAGMVYYTAENFPEEFRTNTFIGNVMTCRINRDAYETHGSTRIAKEMPDFLSCDDPWFRPVDIQQGPDGALYVADFYNRIIGHYEVPLDHPGRDRERGRIWRIVYRGTDTVKIPSPTTADLALPTGADGLIAELASPNLTRRMLALNDLVDRIGADAIAPLLKVLQDKKSATPQKIQALWALHRLGALEQRNLALAAGNAARDLRSHAMQVLAEIPRWTSAHRGLALAGLQDKDAFVQRAAADALGQHAAQDNYPALLALLHKAPTNDTQLVHTVRMSLRNQLATPGSLIKARAAKTSETDARSIADVAVAIPTAEAATYLLKHVQIYREPRELLTRYLRHASRYLPEFDADELVAFVRHQFADDLDLQLTLFKSVQDGMAQRGRTLSPEAVAWGGALADQMLASIDANSLSWINRGIDGRPATVNPWFVQPRKSFDGDALLPFLSSLPGGEAATGVLRSKTFSLPPQLSFFFAGHDGPPASPLKQKNLVRLRDASSLELIREAAPPRKDIATNYVWDLSAFAGKKGFLEVVDGDDARTFAWLAVGRFDPPVIAVPALGPGAVSQREQAAAEIARGLLLSRLEPRLTALLGSDATDFETRAIIARALVTLRPDDNLAAVAPLMGEAAVALELRQRISRSFVERDAGSSAAILSEAVRTVPYRVQVKLAQSLAGSGTGTEKLLALVEKGQATPRLLADRNVKDKLAAATSKDLAARIARLTSRLTPASEEIQKLIDARRVGFATAKTSAADGQRIFVQTCTTCHRMDVTGGLGGPQLDGVGARGLERLVEDILDPNRNVDKAFRTHTILLNDGDVVTGLPRREEGEVLIIAESTGKEVAIPKKNIKERRESETSLMPDNFGEAISEADFYNLIAYLLSKGRPPEAK